MLIGVAQYRIAFGDKQANMQACERLLADARFNGAEMVVFPELSLTGFSLDTALAEEENGITARFFSECAKRYGVACVYGYAKKCGETIQNTLAAVDSDGLLAAEYAKIHPFSIGGEDKVFSAGDKPVCFSFGGIDFGLTICYDLRFPELYSALAVRCGCIINSANWGAARNDHWLALLKARAIEDQCYIVGCNCICDVGMMCGGHSAVFAPDGEQAACAYNDECLLMADISSEKVNSIRSAFPKANDRRFDIYRNFYE